MKVGETAVPALDLADQPVFAQPAALLGLPAGS